MAIVGSSTLASGTVTTVEIFNVTLGAANTEQSQLLSSGGIAGYVIRARGNSELKLTHTATESGTKYITIPACSSFTDERPYSNLTLYWQSPDTGDTVEILVWKI